jgi:hypothetical protein
VWQQPVRALDADGGISSTGATPAAGPPPLPSPRRPPPHSAAHGRPEKGERERKGEEWEIREVMRWHPNTWGPRGSHADSTAT